MNTTQGSYIIINGMHRSGTMFLSRLIDALPNTYIIKDGLRLPWLFYRVETRNNFLYPHACYIHNKIRYDIEKRPLDLKYLKGLLEDEVEQLKLKKAVHHKISSTIQQFNDNMSYKEIYIKLFDELSSYLNIQNVGTKNTHMFQFKNKMLKAYPGLKWIEIIRDVRGWYCSTKVSHPLSIRHSINMWNKAVNYTKNIAPDVRDRYQFLTFEELIERPKISLQNLANFLGCRLTITDEWINNLKLKLNDGSPWYPNPSYTKSGQKKSGDQNKYRTKDYFLFDPVPVLRWKTRLSMIEKKILYALTRKNLKYLEKRNDANAFE